MKSGILPLVALGVGAWFLTKPKQTTTESKSGGKGIVVGSKERGYVITNCNLTIYDEQKAFDFAFNKTAFEAKNSNVENFMNPVKFNLFGDCLTTDEKAKILINSKKKALFVFNMFKFMISGRQSVDETYSVDNALTALNQAKENIAKITGIDTSDFKVELVKKE